MPDINLVSLYETLPAIESDSGSWTRGRIAGALSQALHCRMPIETESDGRGDAILRAGRAAWQQFLEPLRSLTGRCK